MHDPLPPLHVVTDDAVAGRADFVDQAAEVIRIGGARIALHLRAPSASGRRMFDLASRLMKIARSAGAALIVNDRIDIALAVEADGVQLGRRSLGPGDARRIVGSERWIGASVHSIGEAREAVEGGADFLVVGSIYKTASHPGRSGAGVGLIAETAALGVPVTAIGGITPERVDAVRRAGGAGVAVIRGVWDAPDPAAAVRKYLQHWKG